MHTVALAWVAYKFKPSGKILGRIIKFTDVYKNNYDFVKWAIFSNVIM